MRMDGAPSTASVAPCAGAGIEIMKWMQGKRIIMSPPARGRGLKWYDALQGGRRMAVAPCAGAGIEIPKEYRLLRKVTVAPCAGAGIEIAHYHIQSSEGSGSPPARGRGLKFLSGRS